MRKYAFLALSGIILCGCNEAPKEETAEAAQSDIKNGLILQAESATGASFELGEMGDAIDLPADGWASYTINVPQTGRYRLTAMTKGARGSSIWVEDYINNEDDRTYNITGAMEVNGEAEFDSVFVDGSPLKAGEHEIKIHAMGGSASVDWIKLTLLQPHMETPVSHVQNMDGDEWVLAWSDEFDGEGLPDDSKWAYNVGNWGWGNNEPQYYTDARTENVRQENGSLIIEARKNDMGQPWTSARITTAGKESFLYGKIEFKAKVPVGRGTWAAGWFLGDAYEDELSWPYCGEIDVLECVGYEINDSTGDGLNHASCHTRAYYFKQGNHLTATIPVENMNAEWHTYGIEWYPDSIRAYVDNEFYYTYDKTANELEWPFSNPQNIILNLAVGGGWGGAKGIDENWESHLFELDYVRVYGRATAEEE